MTSSSVADSYGLPDGYHHVYSGKVRDLFTTPGGSLLFVASDRISAYDWVLPTQIPDKGRILTALSAWWFEQLESLVPNHVISYDVPERVAGRAMICEQLDMIPVECVARGYLAGSGLAEYQAGGLVCGVPLPPGLVEGSQLPSAIFTPATKAELGEHDENVDLAHVETTVGTQTAHELRDLTVQVFSHAEQIARARGVILADTKFEFGWGRPDTALEGRLVLADEVLTPDSSRYWPADTWQPGRPQASFDKQFVRDWLANESGWNRHGTEPPPPLPDDVVERTRQKYVEAYERITGRSFT